MMGNIEPVIKTTTLYGVIFGVKLYPTVKAECVLLII